MRSVQRVNHNKSREQSTDFAGSTAEYITIKPMGYPLSGMLDDDPQVENRDVFEHYARQQWNGYLACKDEYLFDHRMYPDFAYKIIDVEPPESIIGFQTSIIVQEADNNMSGLEFTSDVSIDDVIGQENARRKCRLIERFLEKPGQFGKWAPRNVLFFGPSGTGKTMLAKALASKTDVPIIPVKATQLIGEYVGEGARQIHQLYDHAEEMAPCIIFIDELDAIALDRRNQELRGDVAEIVNALLTEMDGIAERSGVCTIGATNRAEALDPAVRSRFEEEIEFVLPDENERRRIIELNIATIPLPIEDIDLSGLAKLTAGLSGRDIVEKVLKTALHQAIIDDKDKIIGQHFVDIALKIQKNNNSDVVNRMYI
ncbi:MAG TPA: AAA family ATPase [Methanosarcinaceae archaeon]|nr:AAA family ATPase [Methanosarcinaceae archaeon]